MRATELLIADAMPAWESSTAPRTVAVSGATVSERPEPEDEERREHRRPVGGAGVDAPEQRHADGHDERTDGHRPPRSDALRERTGAGREQQHAQR